MKLFTIIESFGSAQGDGWSSYIEWRGLPFDRFDSIDGILSPSLFTPESEEDWKHVFPESCMTHLITDYKYAAQKRSQMQSGDIVGLRLDDHDESDAAFLGYDLIDGSFDVSLLTNWGNDVDSINRALGPTALIQSLSVVHSIQTHLLSTCDEDAHVDGCRIVSIYSTADTR
ncbi:MAG: hypothetical protein U1A53_24085 [Prosthecobacter sp.]|nr:hypothetical protein [Prosthecobacter sp.]